MSDNPLLMLRQGKLPLGGGELGPKLQQPMSGGVKTKEDILRERQKREATEALEQAANRSDPDRGSTAEPGATDYGRVSGGGVQADVQASEVSLEATLESQVTALRRLAEEWSNKAGEAIRKRDRYTAEYSAAERFLNELRSANAPEVREEAGDSLRGQEPEGSGGRDELRAPDVDESGAKRATEGKEGDPAGEADQGD